MGLADVADQITADRQAVVLAETWGHLAPKPRRAYRGTVLFAFTEYRECTPIRTWFPDLPDSPWFWEGLNRWLLDMVMDGAAESGRVYLWTGRYRFRPTREGQEHEFKGTLIEVPIDTPGYQRQPPE